MDNFTIRYSDEEGCYVKELNPKYVRVCEKFGGLPGVSVTECYLPDEHDMNTVLIFLDCKDILTLNMLSWIISPVRLDRGHYWALELCEMEEDKEQDTLNVCLVSANTNGSCVTGAEANAQLDILLDNFDHLVTSWNMKHSKVNYTPIAVKERIRLDGSTAKQD